MDRRNVLTTLFSAAALAGWTSRLGAKPGGLPVGPIRLIVPNPPGGGTDMVARLLVSELGKVWTAAQLHIDYRPGGGTSIGTAHVARARPDGGTLGIVATPHVINPWLTKLPYDTERDLSPISRIGTSDLLLACSPQFGTGDLGEALARIRANPGRFNCATAGQGSSMHMTLELLRQRAGLRLEHVPFKGAAPAFIELMTGRVEFLVEPVFSCLPYLRDGRLVPLATTGRARNRHLPQVPTLSETFPDLVAQSFFGLVGPAGLDREAIAGIHAGVVVALSGEAARAQIASIGFDLALLAPDAFREFVGAELARWGEVARRANLVPVPG